MADVNVTVDQLEVFKAFGLKAAMPAKVADGVQLSNDLQKAIAAANVDIQPPLAQASPDRTITWKFAYPVIASDVDDLGKLEKLIEGILGVVPSAAGGVGGGSFAQTFTSATGVITTLIGTLRKITDIFSEKPKYGLITTDSFTVTFKRASGDDADKWVGYKLLLDTRWVNGDPGDGDNRGEIQCQRLDVDRDGGHAIRLPLKISGKSDRPTDVYPNKVASTKAKLDKRKTTQSVRYEVFSQAVVGSRIFANFHTEASLVIGVRDAEAAIDELLAMAPVDGGMGLGEGEFVGLDGGEDAIDHVLDVPPTVIATTPEARRLVDALVEGRIPHLGSHLGRMAEEELLAVAEGLGTEVRARATLDRRTIARAIAEQLAGPPCGKPDRDDERA